MKNLIEKTTRQPQLNNRRNGALPLRIAAKQNLNGATTGHSGCDQGNASVANSGYATDITVNDCKPKVIMTTKDVGAVTTNGLTDPLDEQTKETPFPIHCLPGAAAEMAREISRVERVPDSLVGCCMVGIFSASIGAGVQVKSGPERVTRGNLYIVAIAESGTGKSESFRHVARPFQEFERERCDAWRTGSLPALRAEKNLLDSEIGRLKKENIGDSAEHERIRQLLQEKMEALEKIESALHAPVFSVEDATTEKLALLLSEQGECLASLSSDAGSVVNNLLGRYSKGGRTDDNIYLKAFSGDSYQVHRVGRGPVLLNSPCLTLLWLLQPDKIETLLNTPSLTVGGLMSRLLLSDTKCQPQLIVDGIQPILINVITAYEKLIRGMLQNYRLATETVTVTPTPEALHAMNTHFNRIVLRRQNDLLDVTTFAARWNEQAWRISVVLHAALWPTDAGAHELELDTAERAIALADWFAEQQLGILAAGRDSAQRARLERVLLLLRNKPDGVTAREVQRARIAKNAGDARQLLERLENEGHLTGQDLKPPGGGHISRIFKEAKK
jgi:hypothetical protein